MVAAGRDPAGVGAGVRDGHHQRAGHRRDGAARLGDLAVLTATVDCLNVNYSGDTRDWYPYSLQVNTSPATAPPVWSRSPPHAFQATKTLPDNATSVSVSAQCSSGHYPWGDYSGSTGISGIPAGTTAITASVGCSGGPRRPRPLAHHLQRAVGLRSLAGGRAPGSQGRGRVGSSRA